MDILTQMKADAWEAIMRANASQAETNRLFAEAERRNAEIAAEIAKRESKPA